MLLSDFDFELPEELIAQRPLAARDASRMLVVDRVCASWRDARFHDLPGELGAGDTLVVNNTRVFPARLVGRREPGGGRVELLLLRPLPEDGGAPVWEALARPARRLIPGARLSFGDGRRRAEVIAATEEGRRVVRFESAAEFERILEEVGQTPLPPYIKRAADEPLEEDRQRYQTIYARAAGAIAAPTAGLHFTPQIFERIKARGVRLVELTLHVGYGTFEPVRVEDLSQHRVGAERYEISPEAADALNEARARGQRLLAVGTTTVRALESAADETGRIHPGAHETRLTITPGYRFQIVNALITNFHLPRSSLLLLVAAFAGRELTLAAYAHAVAARYRFYSYGDCMLII